MSYRLGAVIVDGGSGDAPGPKMQNGQTHMPVRGMDSSYNSGSPTASIGRAVLVSATWGRPRRPPEAVVYKGSRNRRHDGNRRTHISGDADHPSLLYRMRQIGNHRVG